MVLNFAQCELILINSKRYLKNKKRLVGATWHHRYFFLKFPLLISPNDLISTETISVKPISMPPTQENYTNYLNNLPIPPRPSQLQQTRTKNNFKTPKTSKVKTIHQTRVRPPPTGSSTRPTNLLPILITYFLIPGLSFGFFFLQLRGVTRLGRDRF